MSSSVRRILLLSCNSTGTFVIVPEHAGFCDQFCDFYGIIFGIRVLMGIIARIGDLRGLKPEDDGDPTTFMWRLDKQTRKL
jgi:hypothetical protein